MNVAVASAFTLPVAMLCFLSGHGSLFVLDLVAMVGLGVLGLIRAGLADPGESALIRAVSLPAVLVGGALSALYLLPSGLGLL